MSDPRESSPKWTPGPWFVGGDGGAGDPRMVFCDDALGSSVADCRKHGAGVTSDQARANAHLIAAAPDLLEACKAAKKYLEPHLEEPGRTVFWRLVAALKRANGEAA